MLASEVARLFANVQKNDPNLLHEVAGLGMLLIPGGDIVRDGDDWRSRSGLEADKTGPTLSYERGYAAAILHLILQKALGRRVILVPSAGASNVAGQEEAPSTASVLADEMARVGVSRHDISTEPLAYTTLEHFTFFPPIANREGMLPHQIGIVTMGTQIPRIKELLLQLHPADIYPLRSGATTLISLERVLIAADPDIEGTDERWKERIERWYADPAMMATVCAELFGVMQLQTKFHPVYGVCEFRGVHFRPQGH